MFIGIMRNNTHTNTHTNKKKNPCNSFEIHVGDTGLYSTKQQKARLSHTDYCTYFSLPLLSCLSLSRLWTTRGKYVNSTYSMKRKEIALKGIRESRKVGFISVT